jgi:hypothetical protein
MKKPINKLGLTQSQLSIWLGQKMHPDIPLYNMVHSFELDGKLDKAAFQMAFQELIRKTDSLRTVMREVNGEPVQLIHEDHQY